MKLLKLGSAVCLVAMAVAVSAQAQGSPECRNVSGIIHEVQIPAPNDPIGRVLGLTAGSLTGSETSILTAPPGPTTPTFDVFETISGDVLAANGVAIFTPTSTPGVVTDDLTLTVVWGSGKFTGATGTINVTGEGHNVFPPGDSRGGPGKTYFNLRYKGNVCVPRGQGD